VHSEIFARRNLPLTATAAASDTPAVKSSTTFLGAELKETSRRRFIQSGLAAGSLFVPLPYAWVWAQSEATLKLLRVPKVALVLGNGKYSKGPLQNPANDARAIAEVLKAAGFEVTLRMDAGKAEMAAAVNDHVQAVGAKKCVGLFYYAGHGIQLAWRNYMLPVDAEFASVADIPRQCIELNALLDGLTRAGNPLNLVILDACRNNPFGTLQGLDHKGLSQMDAPTHTLLAYATSPGNVASDGDGANGLYTENLLREIKVPETKVEDIFKRVRLGVRVQSQGAQVPWESTSLEEDFWFIPPKELKPASDAEKEKLFADELAAWDRCKTSATPAPLQDFLRRYPSGRFSELAQLHLDLVLAKQGERRIEIAPAAGNPFTQGFVRADLNYKPGDSYSYREMDPETKTIRRRFTDVVSEVRESEAVFTSGLILDRLGNTIQLPDGLRFTPRQDQPLEFAVGRKWSTRFSAALQGGGRVDSEFVFKISRKEAITVPAGTFDCFVIEGEGEGKTDQGAKMELRLTRWMAPDKVRRPIVSESFRKIRIERGTAGFGGGGPGGFAGRGPGQFAGKGPSGIIERVLHSERLELVAFKQH
jgi:hypothetical protein